MVLIIARMMNASIVYYMLIL